MAVPYFALPALMTTDATERTVLSSVGMIGTTLAYLIASVLTLKVVGMFPTEKEGFFYAVLILAGFSAIFSYVLFFTSRKYDYAGNPLFTRQSAESATLKKKWQAITQNRPFLLIVSAFMGHNMYTAVVLGMTIYFFKYNVKNPALYAIFLGGVLVFSMLGAAVAPLLVKKFGKKQTLQVSNLLTIVGLLALYLISSGKGTAELASLWRVGAPCFFIFLLIGFFGNITPVICAAVMADSVDYGEWKTGQRAQGLISAVFMMANKGGMALGGAFMGLGLMFVDYVPNLPEYPTETLQGILALFLLVPLGCRIFVSVIMWFYNLSDDRFAEIIRELNGKAVKVN